MKTAESRHSVRRAAETRNRLQETDLRNDSARKNHQGFAKGFTLLEVLVAIAVFAVAVSSLLFSLGESTRAQGYIKQRTLAHWVAMNQISLTRMQSKWPGVGITSGTEEMNGVEWHWTRNVIQTSDAKLRRVDIEVRLEPEDESSLVRLSAFVSQEPIKLSAPSGGKQTDSDQNPAQDDSGGTNGGNGGGDNGGGDDK